MRLWHVDLLEHLDRLRLLGQHRECCALRGGGWGKPHSVVNYVFHHSPDYLYTYHLRVMREMARRGYRVAPEWLRYTYRGKSSPEESGSRRFVGRYPEHDRRYYRECISLLLDKAAEADDVELFRHYHRVGRARARA